MKRPDQLSDDDKAALGVWQSKLRDHTLSEQHHSEAKRKIEEILGNGMGGRVYAVEQNLRSLQTVVDEIRVILTNFAEINVDFGEIIGKSIFGEPAENVVPPIADKPTKGNVPKKKRGRPRKKKVEAKLNLTDDVTPAVTDPPKPDASKPETPSNKKEVGRDKSVVSRSIRGPADTAASVPDWLNDADPSVLPPE